MKIRHIEIQNYKCHEHTIISNCSNFHTFIGKNSSGKTSILECCQLLKDHASEIRNIKDKVFGTVTENETKEIIFRIQMELSDDERIEYLNSFFGVKNIDELVATDILRKANLEYKIYVRGTNVSRQEFDNHVIITLIELSGTKGQYMPVVKLDPTGNQLQISVIQQVKPNTLEMKDIESIDKYVTELPITKSDILFFWQFRSNYLQNKLVKDIQRKLNIIASTRESQKRVDTIFVRNVSGVDAHGKNIINLIDTLYTTDHDRFADIERKCKSIFEDIIEIHPGLGEDNKRVIIVRKQNITHDLDLSQEGAGLDQVLIIIWKIALSGPETICILDEPELHLHPGAQNLLYDFLKQETTKGKQIFVATHSMVFIHNSQPNEVSIILSDPISTPRVALLGDLTSDLVEIRKYVFGALGYDPTFAFQRRTIVIVEGKTDIEILKSFAAAFEKPIDNRVTMFMPLGDIRQVKKYTPVVIFAHDGKNCLIVLDNDEHDPKDIKNEIMRQEREFCKNVDSEPILKDDNFKLYPEKVYSIEYYLFEAEAICKAAERMDRLEDIKKEVKVKMSSKMLKPKEVLKEIWNNNEFGPYFEVKTAAKISKFISRQHLDQHPEIERLIDAITA